jgi:hypothetical protein
MEPLQTWLVQLLEQDNPVAPIMRTAWGWPIMESLHFVGLSMLVGAVGIFDLRLLGVGRRIPMAAVRRLVPWGLGGFGLSILTGITFLMTEPNQYIYNPAFLLKVVFMVVAGVNAAIFAVTPFGRLLPDNGGATPRSAKVIATVSLCLWVATIVSGRLITFYRPGVCDPNETRVVATCLP